MAEGKAPEPRGLFLRYCAPCNTTRPSVSGRGDECGECGGDLKIVDAFTLIPALGMKLDQGQRESAVADLPGHDRPAA